MSYNKGLVATLAELEDFYRGQHAGDLIELMNQTNDILSDIPWQEANGTDGHLTRMRTGLPTVYWARLYKGIPPSKGEWTQVKEICGALEARMEIDVRELDLYGDKARAFRLSEAKGFAESMRQKVAHTLFYGDNAATPEEFNGLAMRYSATTKPHVVSAGGATANKQASMYLVSWGSNQITGIYPKNTTAGLSSKDLGEYDALDSAGLRFRCVGDMYSWKCGLAIRDWRCVVRVCNIDTTKLSLAPGANGYIDLQKLTIQAKNMMPENMRNSAVWYCNQDIMTALEMQAIDRNTVHLRYGEAFNSKEVPYLHGRPIRQCDALVSTEAVVA